MKFKPRLDPETWPEFDPDNPALVASRRRLWRWTFVRRWLVPWLGFTAFVVVSFWLAFLTGRWKHPPNRFLHLLAAGMALTIVVTTNLFHVLGVDQRTGRRRDRRGG